MTGIEQLPVAFDQDTIDHVIDPLSPQGECQSAIVPKALLKEKGGRPGRGRPKRRRAGHDIIAIELSGRDEILEI